MLLSRVLNDVRESCIMGLLFALERSLSRMMMNTLAFKDLCTKLLLLALLFAPLSLNADVNTGRPNPGQGPTQVEVEIFLLDLDAINSASQNFEANVYFEASWKDSRLVDETRGNTITRRLDEVWHPRFQLLNQQRVWKSLPDVVDIEPDGTVR